MRMSPEQYFKVRGEPPSPPLFYEVPKEAKPSGEVGRILGPVPIVATPIQVPEIPGTNHTALIIGVVAVVAIVGIVVLGLAYLSRKG